MGALYRTIARPWLFRLDAEDAHLFVMRRLARWRLGRGVVARWCRPDPRLALDLAGLRLPGPVGLAAGLDKQAEAIPAWAALGFGFVEVGTVTPRPQPGNARPRLFRLPEDQAVINRFGFNSDGMEIIARRLEALGPPPIPVGINLGKNKDTPNERARDDYQALVERLGGLASYLVLNVSSPNTPGLRDLQAPVALRALVETVATRTTAPVFVKLAPDLDPDALRDTVTAALDGGARGLVVANTTLSRDGLRSPETLVNEAGGLSGAPLRERAQATLRSVSALTQGRVPLIAAGGIATAADVRERLAAGATAVQVYTALIYEGPLLVRQLNRNLSYSLAAG